MQKQFEVHGKVKQAPTELTEPKNMQIETIKKGHNWISDELFLF